MTSKTVMHKAILAAALLLGVGVRPVAAQTSAELIARAPVTVVVIDNSSDSPGRSPEVMQSAARRVEQILRELPLASSVVVLEIGDPTKRIPLVMRWRIQARATLDGGPVNQVVAQVRKVMLDFPRSEAPDNKEESHLIQGFHDAARLLNPNASGNAIYFISDLLERSRLASCYRDCRLPKPTFSLAGVRLEGIGIGGHLPGNKAIALFKPWQKFFAEAGASDVHLYRTY